MSSKSMIAAVSLALLGSTTAGQAQTVSDDPLSQGRVLQLSFGLFAPQNTLQDTLTTANGGGPQVQSTDLLDFGNGGRFALDYSQPWGGSRLVFSLAGSRVTGETTVDIGGKAESFPGSYDNGYNLPGYWVVGAEVETKLALLSVGREWQLGGNWKVSGGFQGGQASQDLTAEVSAVSGNPPELTVSSQTNNRMLGVFGGLSHYAALGDTMGLRLSATLGVMRNKFDYTYKTVDTGGIVYQQIEASSTGTAVSSKLSARLERSLSEKGVLSLEIGYEGLQGIGNGADTLLDPAGTATTAHVDSDRIGGGYVSLGYAFRF